MAPQHLGEVPKPIGLAIDGVETADEKSQAG